MRREKFEAVQMHTTITEIFVAKGSKKMRLLDRDQDLFIKMGKSNRYAWILTENLALEGEQNLMM